ncbi:hypothetical protein MRB53_042153 [Persea americana]|nr:hypothetical protein MRB53_042153 [Persea americana]
MYKQQVVANKTTQGAWELVDDLAQDNLRQRPQSRSCGSDPITVFSNDEIDLNTSSRGILPVHNGQGLFQGQRQVPRTSSVNTVNLHGLDVLSGDNDTIASLESVLEEVLDSVDAANEIHYRHRSNSRIEEWLGRQSELQATVLKRNGRASTTKLEQVTRNILKDILHIDKTVLDIIFQKPKQPCSDAQRQRVRQFEDQVWRRWIEINQKDSLDMAPGSTAKTQTTETMSSAPLKRSASLERIPWGIPEDNSSEDYWDEEISIPMIFRYLKSYFGKSEAKENFKNDAADADMSKRRRHLSKSVATETSSGMHTGTSTINALNTSRNTNYTRILGPQASRSCIRRSTRSRTSQSSSHRSMSVRTTATCSVASMRRSGLGSNFWDIGSLGGASGYGNCLRHGAKIKDDQSNTRNSKLNSSFWFRTVSCMSLRRCNPRIREIIATRVSRLQTAEDVIIPNSSLFKLPW